jgi:hypothetical protein
MGIYQPMVLSTQSAKKYPTHNYSAACVCYHLGKMVLLTGCGRIIGI